MKRLIPLVLSGILLGYANNQSLAKEIDKMATYNLENPSNELKLNPRGFEISKNLNYSIELKNDHIKNEYNDIIQKIMSMLFGYTNSEPEPLNGCSIKLPKSFEPNVEYGDILEIEGSGITKLDLKIFNQWGVKVLASEFESQPNVLDLGNPFSKKLKLSSTGADDVSSNNEMTEGNYYYTLDVYCHGGDKITKEGEIKLLRTQRK